MKIEANASFALKIENRQENKVERDYSMKFNMSAKQELPEGWNSLYEVLAEAITEQTAEPENS